MLQCCELWDLPEAMGFPAGTARLGSLVDADEFITLELLRDTSAIGLRIIARDDSSEAALAGAAAFLGRVPSLERVVLASVRSIVWLSSADAQIDVGHSEPRWPGLVLVSFPLTSSVGDLRLLEGVIHEAMHINLANVPSLECEGSPERLVYSPWRATDRPASGVLHGAYVFGCVLRFYELLVAGGALDPIQLQYIRKRDAEISAEFADVPRLELGAALSDHGRAICEKIFQYLSFRASDNQEFKGHSPFLRVPQS
jgi:HEXXH motif-containing protein